MHCPSPEPEGDEQRISADVRKEIRRPQILPRILFNLTPKNEEQRPQLAAAGGHLLLCIKPRRHCQCLRPSHLMSPCWLCLVAWEVVQHRCWQALPLILLLHVWRNKINRTLCNRARWELLIMTHLHRDKVRLKI